MPTPSTGRGIRDNTLCLATPLADQYRLALVLGGLIADLVNQAFERVSRLRRWLEPMLLLVLDEAANARPEAARVGLDGRGIGIQLVTVWQKKSQLEAIYGAQRTRSSRTTSPSCSSRACRIPPASTTSDV